MRTGGMILKMYDCKTWFLFNEFVLVTVFRALHQESMFLVNLKRHICLQKACSVFYGLVQQPDKIVLHTIYP